VREILPNFFGYAKIEAFHDELHQRGFRVISEGENIKSFYHVVRTINVWLRIF